MNNTIRIQRLCEDETEHRPCKIKITKLIIDTLTDEQVAAYGKSLAREYEKSLRYARKHKKAGVK